MTVSYALAVSSVGSLTFIRLLKKWKGSILKLVWPELLIWLVLYAIVSLIIHLALSEEQFKLVSTELIHFDDSLKYFEIRFMLGFFVSIVVDRWKQILQNISFIETVALSLSTLIRGKDDNVRLARRSIIRYLVLSQILVYRDISMRVRRRFPTMKKLIECGFLFENELKELDEIDTAYNKYWVPINWANTIVSRMALQKYIDAPVSTNNILNNIRDFRIALDNLCKFDWVPIPVAYPQVVFIAVRMYFFICIFSRQYFPENGEIFIIRFFPIMTTLQFIFYIGWMKVAEALLNPFGEDDDDFEGNWVIDKNISTGMRIVDESHDDCPALNIDQFSDPKFGPMYPDSSTGHIGSLHGSAADVIIFEATPSSKMVSLDAESKPKPTASLRQRFSRLSSRATLRRSLSDQNPTDPQLNLKSPGSQSVQNPFTILDLVAETEENENDGSKSA